MPLLTITGHESTVAFDEESRVAGGSGRKNGGVEEPSSRVKGGDYNFFKKRIKKKKQEKGG